MKSAETIKEWIVRNELKGAEERLEKLKKIEAPDIVIEGRQKELEELRAGKLKIAGKLEKLENLVTGFEIKTGRMGKKYIEFKDGTKYFPNAKYGRYIA